MSKKMYYKNREGYFLNPKSFKRLNGGRSLSKSQLSLLRLERVFMENRQSNGQRLQRQNRKSS